MRERQSLKQLRKQLREYETKCDSEEEGKKKEQMMRDLKEQVNRLQTMLKQARRNLTREINTTTKKRNEIETLEKQKILLEEQLQDKDVEIVEKVKEVQTESVRKLKLLEMQQSQLVRKKDLSSKELKQSKTIITKLKSQMKDLLALTENQKNQLEAVQELRLKEKTKHGELSQHTEQLQVEIGALRESDSVVAFEKLKEENVALRSELCVFDAQFFDEIEDLKYREQQQCELNAKLNEEVLELKATLTRLKQSIST